MTSTFRPHGRSAWLLSLSFAGIAGLLLVTHFVSRARTRDEQAQVDLIVENALTSVRLASRMGLDVEREKTLVDAHIIEPADAPRRAVERRLAEVRADFDAAAVEYDELASFPGESRAWRRLATDVERVRDSLDGALALSRLHEADRARAALLALTPSFTAVEQDVSTLVALNRAEADRARWEIRRLQRRDLSARAALVLGLTVITLVVGGWVTRLFAIRERQIRRATVALEQQNRELDAFAGRVAHDLRGPMSVIAMSASRVAERLPEDAAVSLLQRGVRRMDELIEDLLQLSRAGAQAADGAARTEVVASAIEEELTPRVRDVAGHLRFDIEPAEVRCKEGLLRNVLWNLAENAVKYRRPDVTLELEVSGHRSRQDYVFRVRDNGWGMTAEEARRAFEPFFRGGHAGAEPGTGLGLSIVRRVVESTGGSVGVESERGQGTTFVVRLPLGAQA